MKPRDIIRSPKTVAKEGDWKVVTGKGKMPGTAFPLSKHHSVILGRNWHWRVDLVSDGTEMYRLLTAFNPDVEEYRASLALVRGDVGIVVATLEFHGNHPGWHAHMSCCDIEDVEPGEGRPRTMNRFPGGFEPHRRVDFDVTESNGLAKSLSFFHVTAVPEDALL